MLLMLVDIEHEDDKAFMLNLYRDYYGLVFKNIHNLLYDVKETEDLINDTFIKLIEKVSLLRTFNNYKITTYVVYTARSVAINFIKHRKVQNKHLYLGFEDDISQDIPYHGDSLDESLIHQQNIELLSNAIMKLPEKLKDLLYFKYILEMSNEEIANNFSIAPNSVRQYLTRARRKAKKIIEREMKEHAGE